MSENKTNSPAGLSDLEYARHILEEVLGFPCKGNVELMADCLRSIGKSKSLGPQKAHGYMVRAIKLAKEQGINTDRMWFMSGEYMHVRPRSPVMQTYVKPTPAERAAFEAHKQTPEYQEMKNKLLETFTELRKRTAMVKAAGV